MRGSRAELGTTRIAQNGYHYTKTDEGWKLSHHIVAEGKLGRPLRATERVVFLDRDKTNLDPNNLDVRRKTTSSLRKRLANVEARIEELTAERDAIHEKIRKTEEGEV